MTDTLQRVTLVTETFAPEINGVAHTLSQLVNGLRQHGIAIQIIRPRQDGSDQDNQHEGVETVTLPGFPIPGYKSLHFGVPFSGRIRKALQRFAPQAIYVATEGPMGWAAVQAARQAGIRIISGFHTNFHQYLSHYSLAALQTMAFRYLRYFHNQTASTLVPTRQQRDELADQGFQNVGVLSRGVDSERFHPHHRRNELRRQWGVGENDLVLLCVGRIAAEKNLALALEAHRRLLELDNRIKLVLVGDGPELPHIRQHHPDVICCGMKRGQELAEHYASGDIFLFTSKTDTFGNVLTEAMASGLAVVSFDCAGAHEHIVHGETGMLAPLAEDSTWLQRLDTLIDSPHLLARIRQQAREYAEGLSWNRIVDDFIQRLQGAQDQELSYGQYQTTAD